MFAEDKRAFLADFGVPVTVGGNTFTGIFDNATYSVDTGIGPGTDIQQPKVLLGDEDVVTGSIVYGTSMNVNAVPYVARTFAPDGTGFTLITLSRA